MTLVERLHQMGRGVDIICFSLRRVLWLLASAAGLYMFVILGHASVCFHFHGFICARTAFRVLAFVGLRGWMLDALLSTSNRTRSRRQ